MGRINATSQHKETLASHFSHPHHPFKLINHGQLTPNQSSSSCSACKLKPSGMIYSCTLCTYFLHKKCFEMPHQITHPFHKDHPFTILPAPAYAEGLFRCDACRESGDGFSYHCKPCGVDLHILCAAAPLSLATAHHRHELALSFESPYGDKSFCCDICKAQGSNQWLYRCSLCDFDAHLKCARGAPPQPQPPAPAAAGYFRSVPVAQAPAPMGLSRQNEMVYQAMMHNIENNKAMTEAMIARMAGGGGGGFGGGGGSVQQMMQMISGLNSGGGGFGGSGGSVQQMMQMMSGLNNGGGGGGGIPGLDAFGGGGVESLQSLLGGVGGGGLDLLGGGGLDFVGGALGSLL